MRLWFVGIVFSFFSIPTMGKVQVAYCADISGSANGVLGHVNQSIWSISNEFSKHNKTLELAMVGYGRASCNQYRGNNEVISDFKASVFDLGNDLMRKTNTPGGAAAIHYEAFKTSLLRLDWDKSEKTKKLMIAIVNGDVQYQKMKDVEKWLMKKGVKLTIIYFQSEKHNTYSNKWFELSKFLETGFHKINTEKSQVQSNKNYDASYISALQEDFITTLLPYGTSGNRFENNLEYLISKGMEVPHDLSESMIAYFLSRTFQEYMSKYDLVSLFMLEPDKVSKIDKKDLPSILRGFDKDQLLNYLAIKAKQRKLLMKKALVEDEKRTNYNIKQLLKSQNYSEKNLFEIILNEVNQIFPIIYSNAELSLLNK